MLDIIRHITFIRFEKLTGLKGTFEGTFEILSNSEPENGPVVLRYILEDNNGVVFSQNENNIVVLFLPSESDDWRQNYIEHFKSGRNFLITKLGYGRGEGIKFTGSPN